MPEKEREELAALYRTKGLSDHEADMVATRLMQDPESALDTKIREELGLDPDELGSPWGAAAYSFAAFALGAFIPLLPFLITEGTAAIVLLVGGVFVLFIGLGGTLTGGNAAAVIDVGGQAYYRDDFYRAFKRQESNLQELQAHGIEGFVAMGRERDGTPKEPAPTLAATRRMARKMKTERARRHYRKRKYLAEPPFAWIKAVMGFRRFSVRGHPNVTHEWTLTCLAANLRRLHGKLEWA